MPSLAHRAPVEAAGAHLMDERERQLLKQLYDLQVQLFDHQGDEIEALRRANESLRKSHETIGKMLELMADLIGFS
jgi:hypothetical protein